MSARPQRPLAFGVVGLGFGRCHAQVLAGMEGVEIAAVAEIAPEAQGLDLDAFAARLGARPYRDGRELLAAERLDAVVLAVPPAARDALLDAALEGGVAVFLEKPLAADPEAGAAVLARCRAPGAPPVMIDFCLRHLPAVVRLRELVAGPLGPPLLASADIVLPRHDSPAWVWSPADGNGIVNENTCHLFDVVCALLGEPESVLASGGSYLGAPLEDGVATVLRFAGGATATLTGGALGAAALETPARLSLYTAHGQAVLSGRDHMFQRLEWATAQDAAAHDEHWERLGRGEIAAYALAHFADSLRAGTPPQPGPEAGLAAVAFAMAVRRSLSEGRAVPLAARRPPGASPGA